MSAELITPGLMAAAAAGQTILTPNTELAAALFDAVERGYRHAGRDVWPTPRVRDFGGWLRERHLRRQLDDATSPRVLTDIEERELWREVIDASDAGRDLLEPAGAARAARRARRAMVEYGIPLQAVANHAKGSEECLAFLDWNRRFDERCWQSDCISSDELLARSAAPAEPFTWIESVMWRPVARRWLERHGPMLLSPSAPRREALLKHAPSAGAELAAIAEWAVENLQSRPHFRAWVCVPDLAQRRAQVVDAMDAALAPQRFTLADERVAAPYGALYAVAGGTPLADFATVRLALDTLVASTGAVPFEKFSALLRAPELQASDTEAAAAALLDLQLRRLGPPEADLAAWLALAERIARSEHLGSIAALLRLRDGLRALAELRGEHPMSGWVASWNRCFEFAPWSMRHRWSSTEYQSAERFRELLAALATSDAFFGMRSRQSAQLILLRAARDTPFQVQTGVPAIWVSGQLIDPWLRYDGLWLAGCTDDRWPPATEPVPLLPVRLQREHGVIAASAASQLRFALDLHGCWAARASRSVFSYADPGDGRAARPSPVLPHDAAPMAAISPTVAQPHWHALLAAAPVLERLDDELAPPFSAVERTRGVATIRAQSRCAFRGFAETRLRTERMERPVPGFNERERGDLLHYALEHIWAVLRDSNTLHGLSPETQTELVEDAVTRALDKQCRRRDPGPRWRLREHARMHAVLRKWLDVERHRESFEVEYLEQGSQGARHAGLEFAVRIDRVDRLSDGSRVLLDYKTGVTTADWRGDRPDNPQLPIYALQRPEALVAVAYARVNAADCGFVAEAERGALFKPGGRKSSLEGRQDFAELIDLWSGRIEKLAADFAAGRAAVAPTPKACKSCRLQGLCRVPATITLGAQAHDVP
ncbi:MAG: PD-(D/E)XK nuclease family protein [Pseudomonadota bacterium]|nr:PD-(D/E)XK nuclease family protein [Pseudomonadota bacterium]